MIGHDGLSLHIMVFVVGRNEFGWPFKPIFFLQDVLQAEGLFY